MTTLLVSRDEFGLETLTLEGDAFRHLFRAARLGVGDDLRVVDGEGAARLATVRSVERRRAELDLGEPAPSNEPARAVEVFVAPPKSGRASWMVEKLTEIGVVGIRLWTTARAPRRYGSGTLERLRRVAVAAVEQSGRSRVPEIAAVSWEEGLELSGRFERRWLLAPGFPPLPASELENEDSLAVLIGPEGGWAPEELDRLASPACLRVGLGPSVLRVETAALVGAARALAG